MLKEDNPKKTCPHCKALFTPPYKRRHGAVYCSQRCYSESDQRKAQGLKMAEKYLAPIARRRKGTSKYGTGICTQCQKEFRSRYAGRRFCSMSCYIASDEFQQRIRRQVVQLQTRSYQAIGLDGPVRLSKPCMECKSEMMVQPKQFQTKKFCSQNCYRLYMAARFDRWIAAPQALALPQGYDEFLTQEKLPCLFNDCDWSGKRLGMHVNSCHGVTASDFKELAGFNRNTALCTADISQMLRPNGLALAAFWNGPGEAGPATVGRSKNIRLEGREHLRKGREIQRQQGSAKEGTCRGCGSKITILPLSHRYFCTADCRTRSYSRRRFELICDHCGAKFLGTAQQRLRYKRKLPICCSVACRNARNIIFVPNMQKHLMRTKHD